MEGYYLQPGTPGYDAGMLLPNFNDNYKGAAPDVGAYENGDVLIITGVGSDSSNANRLANITAVKPGTTNPAADSVKAIIAQSANKDEGDGFTEVKPIAASTNSILIPNPATLVTRVSFSLSKPQQVSIQIFDMMGRRVKNLAEVKMEAGAHQLVWDLLFL